MWCLSSPRRMLHPQGFPYVLVYIYSLCVSCPVSWFCNIRSLPVARKQVSSEILNWNQFPISFDQLHNCHILQILTNLWWEILIEGTLINWTIIAKIEWNSIRLRLCQSDCQLGSNLLFGVHHSASAPSNSIGIKKRGRLRVSFFAARQLTCVHCAAIVRAIDMCGKPHAPSGFIINFTPESESMRRRSHLSKSSTKYNGWSWLGRVRHAPAPIVIDNLVSTSYQQRDGVQQCTTAPK